MVKYLINLINKLVARKQIEEIDKISDTATLALVRFNECHDKCDTMEIKLQELEKKLQALETIKDMRKNEVTPEQVLNEWLNGKEEHNG